MNRDGLLRVWRGEIGLYRAAFGLGGIGITLVFLLGDLLADTVASFSSVAGDVGYIVCGAAELGFAWVVTVATWRAAHRRRPNGRHYSPIGIATALLFVGIQLIFTVAWMGWDGLATMGIVPDMSQIVLRAALGGSDTDPSDLEKLSKSLGDLGR